MENYNYKEVNKATWNAKTKVHLHSSFYDNESFLAGRNSLNEFELNLLGDITGKKVLHLQCHFGQDSISLARMGAEVTAVDLSDESIKTAKELAKQCEVSINFICCDLYDLPNHLNDEFDIVFTSYGTIIWFPDLDQWAGVVAKHIKPEGNFVFVDFHPIVWMYDDDFTKIQYSYKNVEPIVEQEEGSYAEKEAQLNTTCITWNHGLSESMNALLKAGLNLKEINEHNYAPYEFVKGMNEFEKGKYRITVFEDKVPLVFSMLWEKNQF